MSGTKELAGNMVSNLDLGRGVNLGGWLSQAPDRDEHRAAFITRDDFARLAGWRFDNVRLPFDYPLICPGDDGGTLREAGLAWIDTGLVWAEQAGLKAVLDMHQLPGYGFMDPVNNPGATPPLFTDAGKQAQFCGLWRTLARRYLGRFPNLAFELANEIAAPSAAQWNVLAARAAKAIREVDAARPIVVGSNCWNVCSTFTELAAIDDPNIIYNFHFYNPFPFTHQHASWSPEMVYYGQTVRYPGNAPGLRAAAGRAGAEGKGHIAGMLRNLAGFFEDRHSDLGHLRELMAPAFAFAKAHRVPLYCGEFGVIDRAPAEDARRWYRDTLQIFAENGVGWSVWSYKGMGFGIVDRAGAVRDPELLATLRDAPRGI